MKTPQEYVELFAESLDWEELITTIQKEAWNEAVDACAKSADILIVYKPITSTTDQRPDIAACAVDGKSILKNKI